MVHSKISNYEEEKKQFYENFVKFWKLEQLKFHEIEIEQKNPD